MPLVTPIADSRSDALSSVSSPFLRADCSSLTTLLSRRDADVPVSTPHQRTRFPKLKHLVLSPGQSWEEQEWELPTGDGIFNEHLSLWHSTVFENRRSYLLPYRWAAQVKNWEQLACRYPTTELRRHYLKSHTSVQCSFHRSHLHILAFLCGTFPSSLHFYLSHFLLSPSFSKTTCPL